MNIIWTAKNSIFEYCTTAYELTKTLYKCTYGPQSRVIESREEIIAKKCLQMREVLHIKVVKGTAEEMAFNIRLTMTMRKLLPESIREISKIDNQDAYQQGLSSLAANSNSQNSAFHLTLIAWKDSFGVVNNVKDCPDLFFNDLIQEVVQSDFSIKDKFYVINKVLECYNKYIDRCIAAHCLDDSNDPVTFSPKAFSDILNKCIVDTEEYRERLANEGESPEYKKLRVNAGDLLSFKGLIVNQLELLLQSYKVALSSLPQLSKDYSWTECRDNIDTFFRIDYCLKSVSILFKLIEMLPDGGLKSALNTGFVNYLTFIKFNTAWKWGVFVAHLMLFNNGSQVWLHSVANRYLYAILLAGYSISIGVFVMTAILPKALISFGIKSIDDAMMLNSNFLFPLLYFASVVGNCYSLGKWIYS